MTVYNVNVEKYFCYKSNVYLIIQALSVACSHV